MKSSIEASDLAAIGRDAFPAVKEKCPQCEGAGKVYRTTEVTARSLTTDEVHGVVEDCPLCKGFGCILRDMTAREEHYWIIKLVIVLGNRIKDP